MNSDRDKKARAKKYIFSLHDIQQSLVFDQSIKDMSMFVFTLKISSDIFFHMFFV